jgi:isoquinoline 1-oxidoreductase alpha subunit
MTPLSLVEGKQVRTIEGMAQQADDGTIVLHPLQRAFIDLQVPQCAWCMSGQIMTAAAFLQQNPAPSEEQIVDALANNYCRCGCYARIKRAVAQAAEQMAGEPAQTLGFSAQSLHEVTA